MARKRRGDGRGDYEGFSTWLRGALERAGYASPGQRGGLTRLAADADVSLSTLSKYQSGESLPDVDSMARLAPYLHTNVREMLLKSGLVLESELVTDTDPLVDPVIDKIYATDLPIEVRRQRAEDFLRRVADARRLAQVELDDDLTHQQDKEAP
ncbi:MAG: helix-turn-helix domain-containing protein [Actinocrinis sp.]